MKKSIALLMALCLLAVNGCETPPPQPSAPVSVNKVVFTDSAGRQVEIPSEITKIAASGLTSQMVLFSLAPELLTGLSMGWPAEAAEFLSEEYLNLPVLGQLYGTADLNLEALAAAAPDLIIDIGEPKKSVVEDMDSLTEKTGIPAVHISAYTETMGDSYRLLGKLLSREAEAEALASYCDSVYAEAVGIMEKVGDSQKSLLYCLGPTGTNVIAEGSYHGEMLEMIGRNLAVMENPTSSGAGNESDIEQISIWNPEVIIFAPGSIYGEIAGNKLWQELDAVKNGNYYETPIGPFNWMGFPPSVNRYMGLLWSLNLLYPYEANYDLYERAVQYYKLFYHCQLTWEQFDKLTLKGKRG